MTTHTGHTAWCAGGHLCNLGEHRARPAVISSPGAGGAVITRVRGTDGVDYAEVRIRINLPADENAARTRLACLLSYLRTLIGPPRIGRTGRAA